MHNVLYGLYNKQYFQVALFNRYILFVRCVGREFLMLFR